ncbi:LuxR C-terminal-related transcriptional regulator [Nocardia sp. NPDC056100]|uniref:LuxR C-terminal-related transcriptional regulator n=1 Tax=Nocardia sp. NPDC056100 TaxID=3345712 RepID=UPI0035D8360E
MLYGRELEERRISTLLNQAGNGQSAALEIVADAGSGKTALLDRAVELTGGTWRILRCAGVDGDSEFPFAGLHALLIAACGHIEALPLDTLPQPQADALRAVIGLTVATQPVDRFLVGLATLSLLAELADEQPVLCTVDDVQWLDRASAEALRFAARRLGAEGIVMLFASRGDAELPGVPELPLPPLDERAAAALLADRWPSLNHAVRRRVLREAGGNPLALLELPRMDLDALPVGPLPLPYRIASGYQRQIAAHSAGCRTALLIAAAEPAGDPRLILQALDALGLDHDSLTEAETAGLIDITAQAIRFRHPLARAAVYHGATFRERQSAHTELAALSTDDPDGRAWHLAAATIGQDEDTAALLESAAARAVNRAGYSAASAAMERAALLTPDREIRSRRMLLATEWAAAAGGYQRASDLARQTEQLPLAADGRARLGWIDAFIEFERGNLRKSRDSLVAAADHVAAVDPERAGPLFLQAGHASWAMGDPVSARAARAKLAALRLPDGERAAFLAAMDGPLALHTDELSTGITIVRATVAAGHSTEDPALMLAATGQAMLIGDLEDARTLANRMLDSAQSRGMISRFPTAALLATASELMLGRLHEAESMAAQAQRVARDIGQGGNIATGETYLALIAGFRGDEQRCHELMASHRSFGQDNFIDHVHHEWALSLLDLAHGRYEPALDRLDALHRVPNRIRGHWLHLLRDLVEAAVRARQPERAAAAMAEIEHWTAALGSPFADAIALRSRALLDGNGEAYATALKIQASEGLRYDQARTALLYGEWLRRERSIGEARTQLRTAAETFDRLGALPWAAHARTELRAAGDASPQLATPMIEAVAALTPQELQVVRLAATGATNKEIGAKLFISPKTVGHHLYRAFPKLGVANRVELARLAAF